MARWGEGCGGEMNDTARVGREVTDREIAGGWEVARGLVTWRNALPEKKRSTLLYCQIRKAKERGRHPETTFLVQIFLKDFFPSFYFYSFCVSENNYISSKLYLFIKRTAHHHNTGVLLRDINKHTHTPRSIISLERARRRRKSISNSKEYIPTLNHQRKRSSNF